jgi:penicillin-binding protein activator
LGDEEADLDPFGGVCADERTGAIAQPPAAQPGATCAPGSSLLTDISNYNIMNALLSRLSLPVCSAALAALVAGCASSSGVRNPSGVPVTHMTADEQGFVAGTGIESQDLVTVADKMSRSILGIPQIANAATPPYVVLNPVDNQTRFPINKDIFLGAIQDQLISQAHGKVVFLARSQMAALEQERNMKRQGAVTASADPNVQEFKGADYFLTGTLQGISTRTAAGTSDYIRYSFHLIDARTSAIVWAGSEQMKKQGQGDAAYR